MLLTPSLIMGDLHLPITNRSEAFKAIRKESLDVFNRLHSINEDASFVSSIAHAYPSFPVVGMNTMPYDIVILIIDAVVSANRRCGVWYGSDRAHARGAGIRARAWSIHQYTAAALAAG